MGFNTVVDPTVDVPVYLNQGATELDIAANGALNILAGGKILAAGVQPATTPVITDSTGGTGSATFAAITAPAANATTSLTADMTAVKNALSEIATILNGVGAALKGAGLTA